MAESATSLSSADLALNSDFHTAIQDLRSLKLLLVDAADFAEASYLRSERKDVEISNIREYAVSMFVNLVDRIGTVADKIAEDTTKEFAGNEIADARVASVSLTVDAYWEFCGWDTLCGQTSKKSIPGSVKRYSFQEGEAEREQFSIERPNFLREDFGFPSDEEEGSHFSRNDSVDLDEGQTPYRLVKPKSFSELSSYSENTPNQVSLPAQSPQFEEIEQHSHHTAASPAGGSQNPSHYSSLSSTTGRYMMNSQFVASEDDESFFTPSAQMPDVEEEVTPGKRRNRLASIFHRRKS